MCEPAEGATTYTNCIAATTTTGSGATTVTIHDAVLPILTNDPNTWYMSSLLSVQQVTQSGLQFLFETAYRMQLQVQEEEEQVEVDDDDDDDDDDGPQTDNGTSRTTAKTTSQKLSLRKQNIIIGTIFYEPSTRTACSFQCAAMKLGGNSIHIDGSNASLATTSIKKGETLYDTVRCIQSYTNCIVLRHYETGCIHAIVKELQQQQLESSSLSSSSEHSKMNGKGSKSSSKSMLLKPLINGGDGIGEHPTQALLDVYTIYSELIRNRQRNKHQTVPSTLIVVVLGDLKHGRTVHSLVQLLLSNVTHGLLYTHQLIIRCCAPNDTLQLPQLPISPTAVAVSDSTITMEYYTDPIKACIDANVLYVTRIQRERFANDEDYQAIKFIATVTSMSKPTTITTQQNGKHHTDVQLPLIVMHPLPRIDEISTDLDSDTNHAVYFKEMEYGMYVRMAMLYLILHKPSTKKKK